MRGRSPARRRSPPFPRPRARKAGAPRTWRSCSARSACATSWSITRVMSTGGWGRTAKSPRRSYWRPISTRSSGPRGTARWSGAARGSEGPGISDNRAGPPALVAVAEAMVAARVPVTRPILFAATVGEEGSGDLRGVKYLLNGNRETLKDSLTVAGNGKPAAFIALDGAGLDRVIHRALGSKRYHVTFRGPGGHSWAAFGVANPANAVGRATALLADLAPQQAPRTTCAVVRLGGGTGLNSIPQEAWLDLDLRSEDPRALAQLDVTVRAALDRAADDEN